MVDLMSRQSSLLPVYAANIACGMGIMGFVAASGPLADVLKLQAWEIGLTATAGGLGWILSARAWGRAADSIGRKRVLVMGITGFCVAYLAICVVAQTGITFALAPAFTIVALAVSRLTAGLFFPAISAVGMAMIADNHTPEERAGAMSRLGAAQASGFVLGPAFVAAIAGSSPTLPLFLMGILPVLALVLVVVRVQATESRQQDEVSPLPLFDRRLRLPLFAALAAIMALGIAQVVVGFVALDRLGSSDSEATRIAGWALSALGVALIMSQFTVGLLNWRPRTLMMAGALIATIALFGAALAHNTEVLIATYAIFGFGGGWIYPAFLALASNAVSADEQGRAAGTIGAAQGIGSMLGPLVGGVLYDLHPFMPYLIASASTGIILLLAVILRQESLYEQSESIGYSEE